MDCHKMAIGFYAGINWPGAMQAMKTKPSGTGKLAHRCICCRCWFNKPRVRTKHPQCLEQLPNFVAASAHQVTARSVSKLISPKGRRWKSKWTNAGMVGRLKNWFTGTSFQVHFSKSCRCPRIFQGYSFLQLASGMPSNALLLCSILNEYHCWIGIAMRQRKLILPVEAAQLVTSCIFLSVFSFSLSSFQFPVV